METAFDPQAKPQGANVNRFLGKHVKEMPANVMKLWQLRPKIFFRDAMDIKMDPWQEDCVDLYLHNQRLGLVASKGPGKTFMLGGMCWHFACTNHQPKIATLSISRDHLMSNFWAELLRLRAQSPLIQSTFTDGMKRMNLIGAEGFSFIDARAFPKQANENEQASALAGLHADNVAFFIDEAGLIPDAVLATADAALTTEEGKMKKAKLVCTANPERPSGTLYRAAMGRSIQKWSIYRVSGDPDDPKRAPRVSMTWAQEQIDMFGRDHPWVLVNVLGEYPATGTENLINEEEVLQSMKRDIPDREVKNSQLRLGVDCARGGIDSMSFAKRKGLKAYPLELLSSETDGPTVARKISWMHSHDLIERVYVDNTGGYGASTLDSLKLYPHIDRTPVVYNGTADEKDLYYNKRTEMWVRLRDWIRSGGCLPNDPLLMEELCAARVDFRGTVIRLEEKKMIKERIGRSPDRADSLAQTFFDVEAPSYYADPEDPYSSTPGPSHGNNGGYTSKASQLDDNHRPPSNYSS